MKKPVGKGGRRHLDNDESSDWDYASRTVEPLKRAKSRVTPGAVLDLDSLPPRSKADQGKAQAQPKSSTAPPVHPPSRRATPAIADFDRKSAKKLRSGRIEIEARMDLHGMRQNEAHTALRGFLHRAQAKGLRWVLVITGKGKVSSSADGDDDVLPLRDRGVLKRNVPRWLEEPDIRALVISYTTASIAHGGEGALYVHLRKKV